MTSPPDSPLLLIQHWIAAGHVRWTYHSTMCLKQRGLTAQALHSAVSTLEIIESYPDDKYLPSYLLQGMYDGTVFHAQIAIDIEGGNVRVVTMYRPTPEDWDEDCRMRKSNP